MDEAELQAEVARHRKAFQEKVSRGEQCTYEDYMKEQIEGVDLKKAFCREESEKARKIADSNRFVNRVWPEEKYG